MLKKFSKRGYIHFHLYFQHRSTLCCYQPSVAIRGLMFCNQGQTVNQTKRVWRPLHKPKWWDVFKQTRHNIFTATDLFKGNTTVAPKVAPGEFIFGVLSPPPPIIIIYATICIYRGKPLEYLCTRPQTYRNKP